MNIDFRKLFVGLVVTLILTIPVTTALANKNNQLRIEKSNQQQLQIDIKKRDSELLKKQEELKQKADEAEKLKQQNEQLQKDLQAKRERQAEEARLAAARQKAAVSVATPSVDCDLARRLISQYDWNTTVAYNVMVAESSCNAANENYGDYHSFADCRGSFGLFQINCSHGKVFDPAKNVAIAYSMWKSSGWQPWSATTCRYKVACY